MCVSGDTNWQLDAGYEYGFGPIYLPYYQGDKHYVSSKCPGPLGKSPISIRTLVYSYSYSYLKCWPLSSALIGCNWIDRDWLDKLSIKVWHTHGTLYGAEMYKCTLFLDVVIGQRIMSLIMSLFFDWQQIYIFVDC